MKKIDLENIQSANSSFKETKKTYQTIFTNSLKAKLRMLLGVSKATSGSDFKKKTGVLSEENWRVAWARFYDYNFNADSFHEWFCKIGIDLYILAADKSNKNEIYELLNGAYKGALINYTKGIIGSYSENKNYVYQKSRFLLIFNNTKTKNR